MLASASSKHSDSDDLREALARWRMGRVVVAIRLQRGRDSLGAAPLTDLRGVHFISSCVPCFLFVIGLDAPEVLWDALQIDRTDAVLLTAERVLEAICDWPPALRDALAEAIAVPEAWSVKKVAAVGCASRRTLERYCERAGLPGPAVLLEQFASAAGRLQADTTVLV